MDQEDPDSPHQSQWGNESPLSGPWAGLPVSLVLLELLYLCASAGRDGRLH